MSREYEKFILTVTLKHMKYLLFLGSCVIFHWILNTIYWTLYVAMSNSLQSFSYFIQSYLLIIDIYNLILSCRYYLICFFCKCCQSAGDESVVTSRVQIISTCNIDFIYSSILFSQKIHSIHKFFYLIYGTKNIN